MVINKSRLSLNVKEQNDDFITFSKQHDFTDDSFDNTAWPKGKSPWED